MDLDIICLKPFGSTFDKYHEKFLIVNQGHVRRDWTDSLMASPQGLDVLEYLFRKWSEHRRSLTTSGKWFLEKYVTRMANDGQWLELPFESFHTQQWDGSSNRMCTSIEDCQLMYPGAITVSLRQTTNVPFPTWKRDGGCVMPPKDQLSIIQESSNKGGSKLYPDHFQRDKIAFLLMEYDDITFPDVWSQYFRDADPSDYVLYVHMQNKDIRETMDYNEFQLKHPNVFTVHESMSHMTQNIKLLETNTDAYYYNLIPILLSFWRNAIADESIAGFFPLSGACLPVKKFSVLRQALISDRSEEGMDFSILQFMSDDDRRKAEMWGYLSRRAVSEIILYTDGKDLSDRYECAGGATEEFCPAQLIQHLKLPNMHGMIT